MTTQAIIRNLNRQIIYGHLEMSAKESFDGEEQHKKNAEIMVE
jgi:hypothetical protein